MDLAVGELPDEPCVDGAEQQVSGFGFFAGAFYIFKDPAKLGR